MSNGNDQIDTKEVLKAELGRIDEEIAGLKVARDAVREALKALGVIATRKTGYARKSGETRQAIALDFLRKHPNEDFEPSKLADAIGEGMPASSSYRVVEKLVEERKVTKVGETDRGKPIIKHKPVTTRPGEGVGV